MKLFDLKTFELIDTKTSTGQLWLRNRQRELGASVDGIWGPKTERSWGAVYGDPITDRDDLPALITPRIVLKWGYHHVEGWPIIDSRWFSQTNEYSWINGMMRLVSGHRKGSTFSRPPSSWVSLDSASIGVAHWWSKRMPSVLPLLLAGLTHSQRSHIVGEQLASDMADSSYIKRTLGSERGKTRFKPHHLPLMRGWYALSQHINVREAQVKFWIDSTMPKTLDIIEDVGWALDGDDGGRLAAGVARMVNSAPARAKRCLRVGMQRRGSPLEQLERAMSWPKTEGGYGHVERWEAIKAQPRFVGPYRP